MKIAILLLLSSFTLSPNSIPPDIGARDLSGKSVSLEDYRGKVLLVDFWATWCVPCRKSIPIYAKMHRSLKEQGFEVLAISVDEERKNVDAFAKKNALPFRIVHDIEGSIAEAYEPPKMPTSYLISPEGKLVKIYAGFNHDIHRELEQDITRLLNDLAKTKAKVPDAPKAPSEEPKEETPPSDKEPDPIEPPAGDPSN